MKSGFFSRINDRLGFTRSEIKAAFFLVVSFLVGTGYNYFRNNDEKLPVIYNYSGEDSLFNRLSKNDVKLIEKNVDSKLELLDFTIYKNIKRENPDSALVLSNININNAGISELVRLPGIGVKTAEKIISYRQEKGLFTRKEDIVKVKGIGKSKFDKIKNMICVN